LNLGSIPAKQQLLVEEEDKEHPGKIESRVSPAALVVEVQQMKTCFLVRKLSVHF